jgi:hypothetical protein
MVACVDSLDIPPKSILTKDDIYTEAGMRAYMAGLYNRIPMEDFNVSDDGQSKGGYYYWGNMKWPMLATGENVHGNNLGMYIHTTGYWNDGYQVIRSCNDLLAGLPDYIGILSEAENWIAEARFIRAYTYFALVKRYGGVPLVKESQALVDGDPASLHIARSSCEDSYDFMLEDLDYAIAYMSPLKVNGRANRYVAAAFKSRIANFAGAIARYGGNFSYSVDGVMLQGIPAERANDYFRQAYAAAKVVDEGGYALYREDGATDNGFANVFVKAADSPESIFIRQYQLGSYVHSFDHIYSPARMSVSYGGRYCVTLDWVELFDGLPLDPATGWLKTTNAANQYIVYPSPYALFAHAEPRLKGSLILPGDVFKGLQMDVRRGVIRDSLKQGSTVVYTPDPDNWPIAKFIADDGSTTSGYSGTFKSIVAESTDKYTMQTPYVTTTGVKLNPNGLDGTLGGRGNGSGDNYTGLMGRKWLNPNLTPSTTTIHTSTAPWIDIRYAEVLLNRAEAALELAQNGVPVYDDADMQADAFDCINRIRARAGAALLASPADLSTDAATLRKQGIGGFVMAPNRGLQLIRIERYKELAFEHKIYWDLRRWFTFDTQIKDYRRRMLNPFLFAKGATLNEYGNPEGKYIYDTRICEGSNAALNFGTKYYYEAIPAGQLKTNPLLKQNDQY